MTARIHVVGGLANRLRAMLSFRAIHGTIEVGWDADEYVSHARWSDVFAPLEGVTFTPSRPGDAGSWESGWSVVPDAPAGWERSYADLRPVAGVQDRIDYLTARLGEYVACHIRRTDHVIDVRARGDTLKPYLEYVNWSRSWLDRPLFLATDNAVTQRTIALMRDGAQFQPMPEDSLEVRPSHGRYGTLATAVVDLYVCAGATYFLGTEASSFTDTIEILRRLRK